jgi:hypothetical protein
MHHRGKGFRFGTAGGVVDEILVPSLAGRLPKLFTKRRREYVDESLDYVVP